MAEMASALDRDVTYHTVGARTVTASGGDGLSPAGRLAYRASVLARGYAAGAIAYQWMRSEMVLRSAPKNRLVHCCSHMAYGGYPWIGDYENVNVLAFYSSRLLRNQAFTAHLRHMFSHPSCRAIRVWSATGARSFYSLFPETEIRHKICVVQPAIRIPLEAGRRPDRHTPPRILFLARGFWVKGGPLFLDAVSRLRHDFEFQVDFVCDLPPEGEHYRDALAGVVNFHEPNFSRQELYSRFYANADIFVMLGMADSYGVALLEASAFSLPIVAMRLSSGLSDLLGATKNAIQVEPAHQIFDGCGTQKGYVELYRANQ